MIMDALLFVMAERVSLMVDIVIEVTLYVIFLSIFFWIGCTDEG